MAGLDAKYKIIFIQIIDWGLLLSVTGIGVYGVINLENKKLYALVAVLGLFLVNRLGVYTTAKIAAYKVDREIQEREAKKAASYKKVSVD